MTKIRSKYPIKSPNVDKILGQIPGSESGSRKKKEGSMHYLKYRSTTRPKISKNEPHQETPIGSIQGERKKHIKEKWSIRHKRATRPCPQRTVTKRPKLGHRGTEGEAGI